MAVMKPLKIWNVWHNRSIVGKVRASTKETALKKAEDLVIEKNKNVDLIKSPVLVSPAKRR